MTDKKGKKMDIPLLLTKYFKDRLWELRGEDYSGLKFIDELPPVTLEELLSLEG